VPYNRGERRLLHGQFFCYDFAARTRISRAGFSGDPHSLPHVPKPCSYSLHVIELVLAFNKMQLVGMVALVVSSKMFSAGSQLKVVRGLSVDE